MGTAIQDAIGFPCHSDETTREIIRGIRLHLRSVSTVACSLAQDAAAAATPPASACGSALLCVASVRPWHSLLLRGPHVSPGGCLSVANCQQIHQAARQRPHRAGSARLGPQARDLLARSAVPQRHAAPSATDSCCADAVPGALECEHLAHAPPAPLPYAPTTPQLLSRQGEVQREPPGQHDHSGDLPPGPGP